jgi:hypothetical protein
MPDAKWRMPQQGEYFSIFLLYEDGEVINAFTNSVQAEALVRVLRKVDEERGERYNYHIRSMYTEPHDNNV